MDKYSAAFMSYARFDDQHNSGQLTKFRKLLSGEVRAHLGVQFDIFQDTSDIAWGQDWKKRICAGIDECALFMPIITPSFFTSPACRDELERIIARESELGRDDLILPIYYISCPILDGTQNPEDDRLAKAIIARNYFDMRDLRGRAPSLRVFQTKLTELAMQVVDALERHRPKRRRAISSSGAVISSLHGAAGLVPVAGADALAKMAIPTHTDLGSLADGQRATELLNWWNQMRHRFAAVEGTQEDA